MDRVNYGTNHAAVYAQRRAVGCGRKRARHKRHQGRHFFRRRKPSQQRRWPDVLEELPFDGRAVRPRSPPCSDKPSTPSEAVGPGRTEFTVTPRSGGGLGQASRNSQLRVFVIP